MDYRSDASAATRRIQVKNIHFLLIVIGLTALSGWLYTKFPYQMGLDIEGGVRVVYRMKTEELTPEQRQNIDVVRANLQKILVARVSKNLGVVEGNVVAKMPDQFIVELPGFKDTGQAKEVLSSTASIRMYHARNVVTAKKTARPYSIGDDRGMVDGRPEIKFTRRDGTSVEPGSTEYARMIEGWGEPILQGGDLERASTRQQGNNYQPEMYFAPSGAEKLRTWTTRYRNDGEHIAFVLDGIVLSIAPLKEGAILSDQAFIDGQFEATYVSNLVELLNAGALPIGLEELSSSTVDPTIGRGALNKILFAGQIAFAAIAAFLILYYAFPGFVALIALVLYGLFTLTALKLLGATFSLASIAGFILSVGMAVDANVLVFERLKEEMRRGRALNKGIDLGFKRALSAIVDSNACTILTSLVLYNFGDGPVKGFATTLIIGVAISLFTAVTVTRSLLFVFSATPVGRNPKYYALNRNWFGESLEAHAEDKPLKVLQKSKLYFIVSGAVMAIGLIFVAMGGIKPNVEFTGGIRAEYRIKDTDAVSAHEIGDKLEAAGMPGGVVTISGAPVAGEKVVAITLPESDNVRLDDAEADAKILQASGVTSLGSAGLSKIGPTVRDETVRNAINGVVFSTLLIVIYLAVRFGLGMGGFRVGFRFGMSSVAALVHDVVVVVGFAGIMGYLFNWQISALFITSMLTVAGFSTHDTIVIFDRIRENLRGNKANRDLESIINISITQSFARSINTSFTVIIALVLLLTVGATTIDLSFFNAVMLIGILVGTYSSIFNASPVLYLWDKLALKRRGEADTLVGHARAELVQQRQVATAVDTAPAQDRVFRDAQGNVYGQVKRRDSTTSKRPSVPVDEDE